METTATPNMTICALFDAASRTCEGMRYKPAGLIVSLRTCGSRPRRGRRDKFCWGQSELHAEKEAEAADGAECGGESEHGTEDDIVEPTAEPRAGGSRKGRKGRKGQAKGKGPKRKGKKAVGCTMSSSVPGD